MKGNSTSHRAFAGKSAITNGSAAETANIPASSPSILIYLLFGFADHFFFHASLLMLQNEAIQGWERVVSFCK